MSCSMSTIRVRVPITCTVNILPVIITGEHSYWSGIIWGAGYVYHFQFVTLSKHLNLINTDHVTFIICIIVTVKMMQAANVPFHFQTTGSNSRNNLHPGASRWRNPFAGTAVLLQPDSKPVQIHDENGI